MDMKQILKSKVTRIMLLTINVLLFVACSNKTATQIRSSDTGVGKSPNYFDVYDKLMVSKVQKAAVNVLEKDKIFNPSFKDTVIEEQYVAKFCQCYVESNNILELTLKSDSTECSSEIVGYQRFRLTRYKITTTLNKELSFYAFAAIEQNGDRNERMQNFYISKEITVANMPNSIHFESRYNYDLEYLREKSKGVDYEFKFNLDKSLIDNTLCLKKIINHQYNMISGNKALAFDIMKSFDTNGIVLKKQDRSAFRLAER
jgi:hypothetical protein